MHNHKPFPSADTLVFQPLFRHRAQSSSQSLSLPLSYCYDLPSLPFPSPEKSRCARPWMGLREVVPEEHRGLRVGGGCDGIPRGFVVVKGWGGLLMGGGGGGRLWLSLLS
ncbi:hypothetical protein Acr_09g0002510 [Actinidia rufa]|uniref:Uncharacterized protein n=1 Tax=Actinidia rufa TaxID=165716 RepID=A0A7J0F524_9ERIC|nr:hypothetical protein Acr_09g0002510 [Actinidia rufa]